MTQNGGTLDYSGSSTLNFSNTGALAFTGSGANSLTLTGTGTASFAPSIVDGTGGSTSLTKSGSGTWTLTGANTFTGTTMITNTGYLDLDSATSTTTTLALQDSLVDLTQNFDLKFGSTTSTGIVNATFGGLEGNGNLNLQNTNTTSAPVALTLNTAMGTSVSYGGVLSGTGSIIKTGNGTQTFTNASNSYSGGTTVSGGTLVSTAAGALGSTSGTLAVNGGGTLDIDHVNQTVGAMTLGIANNSAGSTIQSTGGAATLTATSVTVNGTSNVIASGTVSTGNVTVNGSLAVNTANGLNASGTVAVNNGGTLLFGASGATNAAAVTLNGGGTIGISGISSASQTLGALTLGTGTSIINFGSGLGNTITFASLANAALLGAGATLDIYDWSGTGSNPADTGNPNQDRLLFAADPSLNSTELGSIYFFSDSGTTQIGTGSKEISFGASPQIEVYPVPEPSTIFSGVCLLGLLGWRRRRQIQELALAVLRQ